MQPERTTLDQIKLKVRRITKSPNPNQLSEQQLNDYINWFYLYDFPEELRLKSLKSNYVFFTKAHQDRYAFPTDDFVTVEPPLYVAGFEAQYSQSQTEFFRHYPKIQTLQDAVATGDGTEGPYNFTVTGVPLLKQEVFVTTEDVGGDAISLRDDGEGNLFEADTTQINISNVQLTNPVIVTAKDHRLQTGDTVTILGVQGTTELNSGVYIVTVINDNNFSLDGVDGTGFTAYTSGGIVVPGEVSFGTVDYLSGAIEVEFRSPIASGQAIDFGGVQYQASRPFAALFFNNEFILRPVPDRGYKVSIEAFRNPIRMLDSSENPHIKEWWELIALGAALKIFTDRRELQVLAQYQPLYDQQLTQSLRRTIIQQRNQRAATIYDDGMSGTLQGQRGQGGL